MVEPKYRRGDKVCIVYTTWPNSTDFNQKYAGKICTVISSKVLDSKFCYYELEGAPGRWLEDILELVKDK